MNTYDTLRRFYAQLVTATAGVTESRIVDAFASVKREQFVGVGPWHIQVAGGYMVTETDNPAVLYQDINIGLAPKRGVNNGEPSLHAKCMAAAAVNQGEVVIHVGAGSGYYTAMLAHLVGLNGRVHAYEIEADMAHWATQNLTEYGVVTVYAHSALGLPLPSADVIYVSAGATHVPGEWLDALAPDGRLVLPLTPNERLGCMLLVTRRYDTAYAARVFSPAAFIPCVGARDDEQSRALAAALDARSVDDIRSLQRGTQPDDTAWCVGNGWWLSTAEPVGHAHGA
jgi:protein-L-isoaspartate(D-aspartate) O-methyltransferase